jgi:hypothetical protein
VRGEERREERSDSSKGRVERWREREREYLSVERDNELHSR